MREMGAEGFLLPCWLNAGRNFVSSVPRQVSSRASQLPTGRFCRWETLPIPWEMLPIPWLNSAPAHIQPGLLASKKNPFAPRGAGPHRSCPPIAPPSAVPVGLPPNLRRAGARGSPTGPRRALFCPWCRGCASAEGNVLLETP